VWNTSASESWLSSVQVESQGPTGPPSTANEVSVSSNLTTGQPSQLTNFSRAFSSAKNCAGYGTLLLLGGERDISDVVIARRCTGS
jgi:hypothetical protein